MTVYLVTSLHRSGSSMMMRGLIAGGMQGVYGNKQDWLNVEAGRSGYVPNPHGFFALDDPSEFARPDFAEEYAGKLVKLPPGMALRLPVGDYKVVFMQRAPAQIFASMEAMSPHGLFTLEPAIWFYAKVRDALILALQARGAVVDVVKFADVMASPVAEFTKLSVAGWPINPALSAAVVDPALYRSV